MWTALHAFWVPSVTYNRLWKKPYTGHAKGRSILLMPTVQELLFLCHFTCSEGGRHSSPLCKGLPDGRCHCLPNLLAEGISESFTTWVTQQTGRQAPTLAAKATQLTILSAQKDKKQLQAFH